MNGTASRDHPAIHRFSLDADALRGARDRFHEGVGQPVTRLGIPSVHSESCWCKATMLVLADLALGTLAAGGVSVARTPRLIAMDHAEDLVLCLRVRGTVFVTGRSRNLELSTGKAMLLPYAEPGSVRFPNDGASYLGVQIPRTAIEPRVTALDDAVMRPIPPDNEALRLLTRYLTGLWRSPVPSSPPVQHAVVNHVHDLVALTISAAFHGEIPAESNGLRAARLVSLKADIDENLVCGDITPAAVAARQGITPRYLRKLFNEEETSFSRFVLERRLERARHLLENPFYNRRTITDIACQAGFKDLSYFNRSFRRRYLATPTDVREQARRRNRTDTE